MLHLRPGDRARQLMSSRGHEPTEARCGVLRCAVLCCAVQLWVPH